MKTLNVTVARQNLGAWLKRALNGEDIGVVYNGQIVALRRVRVYSEDYGEQEYGMTPVELDRAVGKISGRLDAAKKAKKMKPFTGKLPRG
jgi:antitoxin (DNA-binding transcriptional repressor) of toxin-antitoxin stability system